ncbi:hypothetical protein L2E82_47311 [Cichorium intybus]|uniref:Uncharacterized protein n=1 Tax=Cichorium intybus TaxID=13427 RepID=A0ACB8YVU7_CICIN|nr:hypothetical protein L2E82_47311 [Cichorium intybus]
MALNFDTNLMKIADEFSEFDLLKPKDRPGSHFRTQETDSVFILSVQLEGYKRTDIKVMKNKDGSIITICGEKPVQDMLMVGGKVIKKDIKIQRFGISFKVPQGVVLDKAKARFNEDVSGLIIRMPKATKGFMGMRIEELKTKESPTESTEFLPVYAVNEELSEQENDDDQDLTRHMKDGGLQDNKNRLREDKEKREEGQVGTNHGDSKEDDSQEPNLPERRFKICTPVIFGSTFFVSLIVLVFHLVKSKKPVEEQKNTDQD